MDAFPEYMAGFPNELPNPGDSIGPIGEHGTSYMFHGIDENFWVIDGPVGVRSEIHRLDDGTFAILRTDGKTVNEGTGDTWEEIAVQYF
ncbi:MAG TPA: hypothetical protein VHU90_04455 [Galbitalea sp.]|jgi:hypothetical protein|nr:hypothetical protein [Galbitalea sp.]